MKTIVVSIFVLLGYVGLGQTNLNEYKYIIVPKKFEDFKKENEHQTSTLVKYLLMQKGFLTVYDDAVPDELYSNRCLGLKAKLKNSSSMFSTKVMIVLEDCNGQEVFVTQEGKSRIKEYREAFNEAINNAMGSFDAINYSYKERDINPKPITVNFKNDVKKLEEKQPISIKSGESNQPPAISKEKMTVKEPKNLNPMVVQQATTENQYYKSNEPEVVTMKKKVDDVWYAQALPNGYQLVDSSPKIRMKLLKSSTDNVYMAQSDDKSGMVYQKEGKWIFEYYEGNKLVQEELKIKF